MCMHCFLSVAQADWAATSRCKLGLLPSASPSPERREEMPKKPYFSPFSQTGLHLLCGHLSMGLPLLLQAKPGHTYSHLNRDRFESNLSVIEIKGYGKNAPLGELRNKAPLDKSATVNTP